MYSFQQKQILPLSLGETWTFISNPLNLNEITPPKMKFQILSELPETIYDGLLIPYRVRLPLIGKRFWLTEIKYVKQGYSFVDEQRIGPYSLWYHEHHIREVSGGTEMTDKITYALPLGILGKIAHALFIKKALSGIFNYRRDRLMELFPASHALESNN